MLNVVGSIYAPASRFALKTRSPHHVKRPLSHSPALPLYSNIAQMSRAARSSPQPQGPLFSETNGAPSDVEGEELVQARRNRQERSIRVEDEVGERIKEVFANFLEK